MGNTKTARTLIKVREDNFKVVSDFLKKNDITISSTTHNGDKEPVYIILNTPKNHLLGLVDKIKPFILGNISGC